MRERTTARERDAAPFGDNAAMGKVIFLLNVSLDGYIESPDHSLDWATVDDELHSWFNERERSLEALVYGRRLFEVMNAHWPTAASQPGVSDIEIEYARIWNEHPKIVVSRTIQEAPAGWRLMSGEPETILTELRRDFSGDLGIGGPTLAEGFIQRGLVDEYGLVVHPVILGGGKRFFPGLERPVGLRLLDTRTFTSGAVYLRYATR